VHDYFDVLGVPSDASAREIRRACERRGRRVSLVELTDIAIDFVDMSAIADRMRAAFFGTDP
jgi:hypothetical protein